MTIYLVVAYAIFIIVPVGLSLSITLRRREIEREITSWRAELGLEKARGRRSRSS
ncbi:MAG: hypothetical protein ACP5JG_15875 [Anaerolineae bacterium]